MLLEKNWAYLIFFSIESSDEASEEGDWPLQSGSESDDQWDELSDYGMDANETKEGSDQEEIDEDDDEDGEEEDGEMDDNEELDVDEDSSLEGDDEDDDIVENGLSD